MRILRAVFSLYGRMMKSLFSFIPPQTRFSFFSAFGGLLAGVLFFAPTLVYLFETWDQEEYSHGYLIPPLALLLLAYKLQDIKPSARGTRQALPLLFLCFALQFFFVIANVRGLQPLLLWVMLSALFLLIYGWKAIRAAWPAFLFLFFAFPLPRGLYYALSLKMQMASTSLGVFLLDLLSIPVFQEGNVIDLGTYKLQVVEACNGVRYLFPLMAFGFLLSIAYKSSPLKRSVLFLSTLPITILMNGLRLMLIGLTVDRWGIHMAEGLLHDLEGWVVFMGCVLCLFGEISLMNRWGQSARLDIDFLGLPQWSRLPAPPESKAHRTGAGLMAVALCVGLFLFFEGATYVRPVTLRQSLSSFPLRVDQWQGNKQAIPEEALAVLGTDDYAMIDYKNAENNDVNLYILYYKMQDGTSNQVVHTPAGCMPSGGWELDSQNVTTVSVALQDRTVPLTLNRMAAHKGDMRTLIYYWYIQNGVTLTSGTLSRLAIIRDALIHRQTNGAMVRLATSIQNGDERAADAKLKRFLETGGWSSLEQGLLTQ